MRSILAVGVIAAFVSLVCDAASPACGRRHRNRCGSTCEPYRTCESCPTYEPSPSAHEPFQPAYGYCDAGLDGMSRPCTISCPGACYAAVSHGVCIKGCVESGFLPSLIATKPTDKISLVAHDCPLSHLDALLGFQKKYSVHISAEMLKKAINIDERGKTVPEIIKILGLKTAH